MKSFKEFLQEKDIAEFEMSGSIVYENPSSSDMASLNKDRANEVRYLCDSSTQSVYVWNARYNIHTDAMRLLTKKGILKNVLVGKGSKSFIPDSLSQSHIERFLSGTATLSGGEITHKESDDIDYLIRQYKKSKKEPDAVAIKMFLKNNIDNLIQKFAFAEKYIKGCTGPNSSLMKLKRSLGD